MPIYKHTGKTEKTLKLLRDQAKQVTKNETEESVDSLGTELLTDQDIEKATNLEELARAVNTELKQLNLSKEDLEGMNKTMGQVEIVNDLDVLNQLTEGQTTAQETVDYVEKMLEEADKLTSSPPVLQDLKDILEEEIEPPQFSPITPVQTKNFDFSEMTTQSTETESSKDSQNYFVFPEQPQIDEQTNSLTAETEQKDMTDNCKNLEVEIDDEEDSDEEMTDDMNTIDIMQTVTSIPSDSTGLSQTKIYHELYNMANVPAHYRRFALFQRNQQNPFLDSDTDRPMTVVNEYRIRQIQYFH